MDWGGPFLRRKGFVLIVLAAGFGLFSGCSSETAGPNRPPVAVAGPDRVVTVFDPVALDAAGSFDPDGDNLEYQWDVVVRPPGARAVITNRLLRKAQLMPDLPGEWVIRLTVSDGWLASDPDVLRVRARERPDRVVCEGDDLVGYDGESDEIYRKTPTRTAATS